MAGKIPPEFIRDVLARVDIVDLIDARVALKPAGSNFVARCPFHNEKTPSFTVSRDKQFYHCFGCGAHGNAIDFLLGYERLDFVEAVETLANSIGMEVPRGQSEPDARQQAELAKRLYEVQESATRFYQSQLRVHPTAGRAVEYLKSRGVTGELAQRYRLGYAPPGWQNLPAALPGELLELAGLIVAKDGRSYDRFRERIIFPIRDRRGRVVGFGGRVLGQELPKYLNSPETVVFKKHREVYGLFELLNAVPKPEFILVVEGYMDVIALAQFGILNAVGTLGTATSSEHLELLFRYSPELIFCFDGDAAGKKAAWKALEVGLPALKDGRRVRFLMLPDSHDPDSLVRSEGTQGFMDRLANAQPLSDFFFEHYRERFDLSSLEGRSALADAARPLIDRLPAGVFRELMERRLAELTGDGRVEKRQKTVRTSSSSFPQDRLARLSPNIRTFFAYLLQYPHLASTLQPETRQFLEGMGKAGGLAKVILGLLDGQPDLTPTQIREFFQGTPEEEWIAELVNCDLPKPTDGGRVEFDAAIRSLESRSDEDGINKERRAALVRKSETVGLSPEEKNELRRLSGGQKEDVTMIGKD